MSAQAQEPKMFASLTSSRTQDDKTLRAQRRGRNYSMPKSRCKTRSEWRVRPGKSPERLPAHYHLECEFGSDVMLSWRDDGVEPLYVCEEHAKEIAHLAELRSAQVHAVEARSIEVREKTSGDKLQESLPESEPKPESAAAVETTAQLASVPAPDVASELASDVASPALQTASTGESEVPSDADTDSETKKSPRTRAERCAAIDQLICELAAKVESAFSESETKISVWNTIDAPLEKATQEIIGNQSISDTQKDVALQQLGALQQSLKQDTAEEITPRQANTIKQTVWNSLTGESAVSDEAKPAYRAVYDSLDAAIHAATPKVRHLEARVTNLQKMKAELQNSAPASAPADDLAQTPA
jgi:hypothetical protein